MSTPLYLIHKSRQLAEGGRKRKDEVEGEALPHQKQDLLHISSLEKRRKSP